MKLKEFCKDLAFKGPSLTCSFLAWCAVASGTWGVVGVAKFVKAVSY